MRDPVAHLAAEAIGFTGESGAQHGRDRGKSRSERRVADHCWPDHNATNNSGSVAVDARRRAKPDTGVSTRYGDSRSLTPSLMSCCE